MFLRRLPKCQHTIERATSQWREGMGDGQAKRSPPCNRELEVTPGVVGEHSKVGTAGQSIAMPHGPPAYDPVL